MRKNFMFHPAVWFDEANPAGTSTLDPKPGDDKAGGTTATEDEIVFDQWLEKQNDPKLKAAYEKHTSGLLNSVKATRKERDDLDGKLKETLKLVEKGSEVEKQLLKLQEDLAESKRSEAFFEDALLPEIGCNNPRAALLVAKAGDLFGRDGKPDWDAIKKVIPESFTSPTDKKPNKFDASKGNQSGIKPTMSDAIRAAAGKAKSSD